MKQDDSRQLAHYIKEHRDEDFWRELLGSSSRGLQARNEVLKIESTKLTNERNKLIFDNIEEILDKELKRSEIRKEMTNLSRESTSDLIRELSEVEKLPMQQNYKFLVDKEKESSVLIRIQNLLSSVQYSDPSKGQQIETKIKELLVNYPNVQKLLLPKRKVNEKVQSHNHYLQIKKLIECKQLNQDDIALLESEFEPLIVEKLKKKELGRCLVDAWLERPEKEVFWAAEAQDIRQRVSALRNS